MEFDDLSRNVIGCGIEVHRNLGSGLLESKHRQSPSPASCRTPTFHFKWSCQCPFDTRKFYSTTVIESIYSSVVISSSMRLANIPIGLLINFNVTKLKNGIKRLVL
jgi:hypothetical protein